jgi:hypothetical protein
MPILVAEKVHREEWKSDSISQRNSNTALGKDSIRRKEDSRQIVSILSGIADIKRQFWI